MFKITKLAVHEDQFTYTLKITTGFEAAGSIEHVFVKEALESFGPEHFINVISEEIGVLMAKRAKLQLEKLMVKSEQVPPPIVKAENLFVVKAPGKIKDWDLTVEDETVTLEHYGEPISGEFNADELLSFDFTELFDKLAEGKSVVIEGVSVTSVPPSNPKKSTGTEISNTMMELVPGLGETISECPVDKKSCQWWGTVPGTLKGAIIHLNDKHRWTREKIADWLETLDIDIDFKPKEDENEHDD